MKPGSTIVTWVDDLTGSSALEQVLKKILDAAVDGQGGSANYALDRLRLIQQYAEIALKKTV